MNKGFQSHLVKGKTSMLKRYGNSRKQRHLVQYGGLKRATGRDDALVKLGKMKNS